MIQRAIVLFLVLLLIFSPFNAVFAQDGKTAKPNEQKQEDCKGGKAKKNVDCIGQRDVDGKLFNIVSLEKEIAMGKQYAQMIEENARLVKDPVINEYVNEITQNLVRNSDARVPFTVKVIDSDAINAFALPGGFLYVNVGLILAADEEAELAAVMAHEIAHVTARHATRQMTKGQLIQWAMIPLIIFGGAPAQAIYQGLQFGIPLTMLKFTRNAESEADYLGLQYMYAAGYDPTALVSFFEKLREKEAKSPGSVPKIFSSHPPTADRVKKTQEGIAGMLPGKEEYVVTTSEFTEIKSRLAIMLAGRKLEEDKDGKRPTLRRKSERDKKEKKEEDKDKPPVLRRRN